MEQKKIDAVYEVANFLDKKKEVALLKKHIKDNKSLIEAELIVNNSVAKPLIKIMEKNKIPFNNKPFADSEADTNIRKYILKNIEDGKFVEVENVLKNVKNFDFLTKKDHLVKNLGGLTILHFLTRCPFVCYDEIETETDLVNYKSQREAQIRICKNLIKKGFDLSDKYDCICSPIEIAFMENNSAFLEKIPDLIKKIPATHSISQGLVMTYQNSIYSFCGYEPTLKINDKSIPLMCGMLSPYSVFEMSENEYDSLISPDDHIIDVVKLMLKSRPDLMHQEINGVSFYQVLSNGKNEKLFKETIKMMLKNNMEKEVINLLNTNQSGVPAWTKMDNSIIKLLSHDIYDNLYITESQIKQVKNKRMLAICEQKILKQKNKASNKTKTL